MKLTNYLSARHLVWRDAILILLNDFTIAWGGVCPEIILAMLRMGPTLVFGDLIWPKRWELRHGKKRVGQLPTPVRAPPLRQIPKVRWSVATRPSCWTRKSRARACGGTFHCLGLDLHNDSTTKPPSNFVKKGGISKCSKKLEKKLSLSIRRLFGVIIRRGSGRLESINNKKFNKTSDDFPETVRGGAVLANWATSGWSISAQSGNWSSTFVLRTREVCKIWMFGMCLAKVKLFEFETDGFLPPKCCGQTRENLPYQCDCFLIPADQAAGGGG